MSFGYVYVGLRGVEEMTRQYNVNLYTPTMLIFKEHINKPADVIQVYVTSGQDDLPFTPAFT